MVVTHARFRVVPAPPNGFVIEVSGLLDWANAVRLLRLVDARLQLVATGQVPARHLVVDLRHMTELDARAAIILDRAHQACLRHDVAFALAGVSPVAIPLRARQAISRLPTFPSVPAALAGRTL